MEGTGLYLPAPFFDLDYPKSPFKPSHLWITPILTVDNLTFMGITGPENTSRIRLSPITPQHLGGMCHVPQPIEFSSQKTCYHTDELGRNCVESTELSTGPGQSHAHI
jgi:hypothetical protein